MKIRSIKLHDNKYGSQWVDEVEDRWTYDDFKADKNWRKGWISFDCSLYDSRKDWLYLGITSFDSDIFQAYDRKADKFVDLGYSKLADRFDAKFHRSLEFDSQGCVYGAIALLHCPDKYMEAPGGTIIKYDPISGVLTKMPAPLPHVYIQSIALDKQKNIVYCLCFAPEQIISIDLNTGKVHDFGMIGSGYGMMAQGENLVLDDQGAVWSNWSLTRAWQSSAGVDAIRLCKINSGDEKITFFQKGLPTPDGSHGYAKSEGLFNLGDGHIYASGGNGSLYRIETETAEAEYLFTPIADRPSRLASLALAKDGCAYGITGRAGKCELLRFDFKNNKYELLGEIVDTEGNSCLQIHHVSIADDGTIYACENDNPYRSSYLWEIKL